MTQDPLDPDRPRFARLRSVVLAVVEVQGQALKLIGSLLAFVWGLWAAGHVLLVCRFLLRGPIRVSVGAHEADWPFGNPWLFTAIGVAGVLLILAGRRLAGVSIGGCLRTKRQGSSATTSVTVSA